MLGHIEMHDALDLPQTFWMKITLFTAFYQYTWLRSMKKLPGRLPDFQIEKKKETLPLF